VVEVRGIDEHSHALSTMLDDRHRKRMTSV